MVGGFPVACMDRSVTENTQSPLWSCLWTPLGQGGVGALQIKTCAANRKWACKDKMRTAYEWGMLIFPRFFLPQFLIHLNTMMSFA